MCYTIKLLVFQLVLCFNYYTAAGTFQPQFQRIGQVSIRSPAYLYLPLTKGYGKHA